MYNALSTLNTTTELTLSKAPNPQLLPGRRRIGCPHRVCVHGVCVFTAVCVHLGWVKYRAQIPSIVSPYLVVCHVTSLQCLNVARINCLQPLTLKKLVAFSFQCTGRQLLNILSKNSLQYFSKQINRFSTTVLFKDANASVLNTNSFRGVQPLNGRVVTSQMVQTATTVAASSAATSTLSFIIVLLLSNLCWL